MDTTLFVHSVQLMDGNSKKIKLTINSTPQKKTVNSEKKWVEYVPHFWRLKCGPIGRSQRKSLST